MERPFPPWLFAHGSTDTILPEIERNYKPLKGKFIISLRFRFPRHARRRAGFEKFAKNPGDPPASSRNPAGRRSPAPRRPPLWKLLLAGALTGLVGSFFGSGGGIVTVFALRRLFPDDPPENLFASTLLVILPMSALSALVYGLRAGFSLSHALPFLLPSLAGGFAGALLSTRLSAKALKRLFALLLTIAGGILMIRG